MKVADIKAPTVKIECLGVTVSIATHDDDHISKQLAERRCFYEEELLLDLHALGRTGTYVDVGANIGNHTLFFAKVMGQRVYSFEPFPENLRLLKKNIALNGLEKLVRVVGKAAGATAGEGNLEVPSENNLGMVRLAPSGLACKIVALDDVLTKEDVAVIKVDVEGNEYDVLLGALETIRRAKPYLVFEASSPEAHERVAALIKPLGYAYTRSYSATPTHLYVHEEHLSVSRRLGLLLGGIEHMLEQHFRGARTRENNIAFNLKEALKRVTEVAEGAEWLKQELKPVSRLMSEVAKRSDVDSVDKSLKEVGADLGSRIDSINSLYAGLSPQVEEISRRLSDACVIQKNDAKILAELSHKADALSESLVKISSLSSLVPEVEGIRDSVAEIGVSLASSIDEVRDSGLARLANLASAVEGLDLLLRQVEKAATTNKEVARESAREIVGEVKERVETLQAFLTKLQEQGRQIESVVRSSSEDAYRVLERAYERFSQEARDGANEMKRLVNDLRGDVAGLGNVLEVWPEKTRNLLTEEVDRINDSIRRLRDAVSEMDAHRSELKKSYADGVRTITERLELSSASSRDAARSSAAVLEMLQVTQPKLVNKDEMTDALQAVEARLDKRLLQLAERNEKAASSILASLRYREVIERQKLAVSKREAEKEIALEPRRTLLEKLRFHMQKRRDRAAMERILAKAWGEASPVRALWGRWSSVGDEKNGNCRRKWLIGERKATLRLEFRPEPVRRFAKIVFPKAGSSELLLEGQRVETSAGIAEGTWRKVSASSRFSLKGTIPARCAAIELDFALSEEGVDIGKLVSRMELSPSYSVGSKSCPLVTVVMTAFNAEHTIQKSLESLLTQTWQNLEVIVADDHSTDNTRGIVERIAAKDSRVRLLALPNNMGTYCAKNLAVHVARGEFLTFQDSDDISVPTRVEDQVKALKQSPSAAACFCKYVRLDERAEIVMNRGLAARRGVVSPLWRREKFLEVGYFDPVRGGADAEFIARSKRVLGPSALRDISAESYYAYHREGSLSRTQAAVDISNETLDAALGEQRARYQKNFEEFYSDTEKTIYRRHLNAGIRQYDAPTGVIGKNFDRIVPVIAALATIPERIGSLKKTFESLIDQVDFFCVYLNNFDSVPEFLQHERVIIERSQDYGDLKDSGKFFFIHRFPDAYYFTVDDDIIYPKDYVSSMLFRSQFFGKKVVVGVHGVNWKSGSQRFKAGREVFSFRHGLAVNRVVDLLGTGTSMFIPSQTGITLEDIESHGMADIWLSISAKRNRVPMICVSRPAGWLKAIEVQRNSLWASTLMNDVPHMQAVLNAGPWGKDRREEMARELVSRVGENDFRQLLINA